jgi:hypothetical protein
MSSMSLIDSYVPTFSFHERHSVVIDAPAELILRAVRAYRPENDAVFRAMIGLREAPARMMRALRGDGSQPKPAFGIDDFTVLDQDDREVVFGLIGRFWRPDFGLAAIADGTAFAAFDEAGVIKLALNFSTEPHSPDRIRLTTETRAFCPDRASRLKLMPYWYAVRPFSGLIRGRILASVKRSSEAMRTEQA